MSSTMLTATRPEDEANRNEQRRRASRNRDPAAQRQVFMFMCLLSVDLERPFQ